MNRRLDLWMIVVLVGLWLLFFWRLFTPVEADQASLTQGDFSGQFVTFAGYQYQRFAAGEIPLWNPYNNGGLPFIADTQAAVFYPPRLLTIALSHAAGGWTYHALELEMAFHVLAYTLLLYVFVRRMTRSPLGGMVAALVGGYGGFMAGYPPLQLALLEAAIWLPLAALGVYEAGRSPRPRLGWLLLAGSALGLSWLAGHPQTAFFLTYLLIAYWGYQVFAHRWHWMWWVAGCAVIGVVAGGLAAVQLLPGFEYLAQTSRTGFGYDAKANGFPLQDVVQFILPGVVSLYSPLYVGVIGLALALIALWRRVNGAWFWGLVVLVALLWSFGGNGAVFPALYNVLPGLRYFRGQERAAFLVANSLAILAGMGAAHLFQWDGLRDHLAGLRLRMTLNRVLVGGLAFAALLFVVWIGNPSAYGVVIGAAMISLGAFGAVYFILNTVLTNEQRRVWLFLLPVVIAFELFTVNMDADAVYDPIPPQDQIALTPPPLIAQTIPAETDPFAVDGFRGLTDNYGSLYGVRDIDGISPLWLAGMDTLVRGDIPDPAAWSLLGVRYVFTDWAELPIPSRIVDTGEDRFGAVNLHELESPMPFASVAYRLVVVRSDEEAYYLLRDPHFNYRSVVITDQLVNLSGAGDFTPAEVVSFAPERIVLRATAEDDGVLRVALPHYPGWGATVDGEVVEILRTYGALSGIPISAGEHIIELVYDPLTFRIGAVLSLVTAVTVSILGIVLIVRRRSHANDSPHR